jgi:tetratricopeptide (TPR) repeat protein
MKRCLLLLPALLLLFAPVYAQESGSNPVSTDDAFTSLLKRGFALHQQANYRESLPLLQQAWKLDPHDYFVNLLLGIDTLRTGDPEKALPFLTVAARLRPKEEFPYEYSGEAQTLLGRYDQAAIAYRKATVVAPDSPEATEAWIDFTLERFRQLAGQLRSSQAGLAAEYRLQARSYPLGDKKRRQLLEQSVAIDPKAPGIWTELEQADVADGDEAEAKRNAERGSSESSPRAATASLQRGIDDAQAGQCEQAIPVLERGLKSGGAAVYVRFLLSWCYAGEAGKVDARLQRTGGQPAIAHMIRGDVLFRMQGDTATAMAEYQAALAASPHDPKLLERLAEVQVAAGDLMDAEQNAESALALDAHRYSARQTLARIAMEQGRYADALPQLTLLAEQDPRDPGTQISMATALSALGDAQQALLHLEPVLAGGYPDPKGNLHSLLGSLLRKAGRSDEAAQAFAAARKLSETYQQSSHRDQEDSQ